MASNYLSYIYPGQNENEKLYGSYLTGDASKDASSPFGGDFDSYKSSSLGEIGGDGKPWYKDSEIQGAGLQTAGNFLSAYLSSRAQEEENRKQALGAIARNQGAMDSGAFGSMSDAYRAALRRK